MGKLDEARPHLVAQYENFRAGRGPDDWLTERSLGYLRDFMYESGKVDEALNYHLESLRTRLRIGGRDQGDSILAAASEYTAAAKKFERYPGDEQLFDGLIDYGQNQLPKDHPHRAQYLGNLGWLLLQKEQFEQAEPLLLASYEERKKTLGMGHGDVKWLLEAIVGLYTKTGRTDEAAVYQQALDGLAHK
jgi:tetratricopeptide (TPR) repeat protein